MRRSARPIVILATLLALAAIAAPAGGLPTPRSAATSATRNARAGHLIATKRATQCSA